MISEDKNFFYDSPMKFIKFIKMSVTFNDSCNTVEKKLEEFIFLFNKEIERVCNHEEKRKNIVKYARIAEDLYKAENDIKEGKNPSSKNVKDLISLFECIQEKRKLELSQKGFQNDIALRLERKRAKYLIDLTNDFAKKLSTVSMTTLTEEELDFLKIEYKKLLLAVLNNNLEYSYVTLNTNLLIENDFVFLSKERMLNDLREYIKDFESILKDNNMLIKVNLKEETKNLLQVQINRRIKLDDLSNKIEKLTEKANKNFTVDTKLQKIYEF